MNTQITAQNDELHEEIRAYSIGIKNHQNQTQCPGCIKRGAEQPHYVTVNKYTGKAKYVCNTCADIEEGAY